MKAYAAPLSYVRLITAAGGLLLLQSLPTRADNPPAARQQARQLQTRLLCATLFGDVLDPFKALMFRRCLDHPEQVLRPRRLGNLPRLVNRNTVPLVRHRGVSLIAPTAR